MPRTESRTTVHVVFGHQNVDGLLGDGLETVNIVDLDEFHGILVGKDRRPQDTAKVHEQSVPIAIFQDLGETDTATADTADDVAPLDDLLKAAVGGCAGTQ